MKRRLALTSAASAGITLALALVAGEAVVRYHERHRTVVPGTTPTLYYRHARLRHALVRDFSYYGWASVDSFGFRRTPGEVTPGSRHPTVLILGGSTTFDPQVSKDERAWPARLESVLRQGPSSFPGQVINGGVPGYRIMDILVRLETELAAFQPDLLVLYESHNDLYAGLGPQPSRAFTQRPGRAVTLTPWTAWLEEHSLLYAKLAGRVQALRSHSRAAARSAVAGSVPWDSILDAAAGAFERDVESVVAVAQARRIPIVLMTVTHVSAADSVVHDTAIGRSWAYTVSGTPPSVVLDGYRRFAERLHRIARRRGVPIIDGAQSGVAGPEFYAEGDPIHFNDAGADRFAHYVASQLAPLLARQHPIPAAP